MVNLIWNTAPGPLARAVIGQTTTITVSAVDTVSNRDLTYVLIGGKLPVGLTLGRTGVISGIPSFAAPSGTYYSTQTYNFTIRALDPISGKYADCAFNIEVTNYTNANKITWVTAGGSVGKYTSDSGFFSQELEAVDSNNSAIQYSFISGQLPSGLQLVTAKSHNIRAVLKTNPMIVRAAVDVNFFYGQIVHFKGLTGTTELNGNKYYVKMLGINKDNGLPVQPLADVAPGASPYFELYYDSLLLNPVNGRTDFGDYVSGGVVYTNGYLQGTPTITETQNIKEEEFRFTIRATNTANLVTDRSFAFTITNKTEPIILPRRPPAKDAIRVEPYDLGSAVDGAFYYQQLKLIELNPNARIEWTLDDGELPPGVTLSADGIISGYINPVQNVGPWGPDGYDGDVTYKTPSGFDTGIITAEQDYDFGPYDFNNINQSESYSFTIRAYDGADYVKQKYILQIVGRNSWTADSDLPLNNTQLTADIGDVYVPVIRNTSTVLPAGRQNSNYAFKIDGYDFQGRELAYNISNTIGTFDAYVAGIDAGFDYGGAGVGGGDEGGAGFSTDTGLRSGVGFSSYVDGSTGISNLPGVQLDAGSGWVYGKLSAQTTPYQEYTFGVFVSKVQNGQTYSSKTVFFTLPVYGDINNNIVWNSPTNLGTINNGSISELAISATSTIGKKLYYKLFDRSGTLVELPQGLQLLPSGEISGRVSFEAFTLDDYATTFDGNKLTVDRTFNFTVKVADSLDDTLATVYALKEFTLTLNVIDPNPYKNLYLRAMPTFDQRQIYTSVVTNKNYFTNETDYDLIYRPDDPWFGINKNLEMLFLPGLKSKVMAEFTAAMQKNHYTKTYTFGDIKTAVVLDDKYVPKYEVVYLEVLDPEENLQGQGPGLEIDLFVKNPYVDSNGVTHTVVYPNTTKDMIARLIAGVNYEDQNSLPEWMTSNQPDPTSPNKFKTPLGFTKGIVIAHTKPGKSNLIAYRLRNSGINFNRIEFKSDRYIVDDFYSTNFDPATDTYKTSTETTFDSLPNKNIGSIDYTVDYGVTVPFSEINGRPLEYIQANGGIDGLDNFFSGQRLVFIQQEKFNNAGTYDGWVDYTELYGGDDITTSTVEGYGAVPFDQYKIVPGFLEHAQSKTVISASDVVPGITYTIEGIGTTNFATLGAKPNINGVINAGDRFVATSAGNADSGNGIVSYYKVENQRGGIWEIQIVNDVVNLFFVQTVELNRHIRILSGKTYTSAIVFYSLNLKPGQNVPFYEVYRYQAANTIATRTTFNKGGTRFFNFRDKYYEPNTQDKYVKFPQYGVFN
jgi:hypothetical protein